MKESLKRVFSKVKEKAMYIKTMAFMGMVALSTGGAFCTGFDTGIPEVDKAANGIVKIIFGVAKLGGIALAAVGIVKLVNYVSESMNGGNASPADLGKGIAGVVAGLILFFLKSVLGVFGITI